ncbi:MAG: thioredoxin-disulfide reductase [Spirochaetales bacterium]|nr:thioredoxin-disulfide reductase [Spirochaetales bacterium]
MSEKEIEHHKLIIVGSGPAGYTAAIYAARANLHPVMISGFQKGGQLTTTTEIDNFPGFPQGRDGNELMSDMEKQALRFETVIIEDEVTDTDLKSKPFKVETYGKIYTCDALIVSTGATAKYLGLESETKFKGRGVSACATCDGFFFKGKDVAVVGGGDTAVEEAIYLTNFCSKVYLLHRRDELRASKAMQQRAFDNPKVEILWNTEIDEVIGGDTGPMEDLRVVNNKTGEKREIGVKGLFIAVGHKPNTDIFGDQLETDENGYLITEGKSTKTNIEGVFACGDVMDSKYRQAITAAGTGCMAAIDAERWLAEQI